jgi:hypothetical protein
VSERNECTEMVCGFLHCRTNLYTGFNLPNPIMNWVHLRAMYGASSGLWRRRRPQGMEVSCDRYRHIEQIAVDSRQVAILNGIYLEIPSNITLNTTGNNDLALTLLLVLAERIRQHYNLCRIIQYFPQYSQRQSWIKLFVMFIVWTVVIGDISKQYFPFNTHKKETYIYII